MGKPLTPQQGSPGTSPVLWFLVFAVIVNLFVTFANRQQIQRLVTSMESRFTALDTRVAEAAKARPAAPQQQQGRQPDPEKVYALKVEGSPVKGPASAAITIHEVSDFQCPFCSRVVPTLDRIREVYGDQVRFVWKNYPLAMHPDAPLAHLAAIAAGDQGKFWEYHHTLFANQKNIKRPDLVKYARDLGLDVAKFERDLDAKTGQARITADMREADAIGDFGTPAFFINGRFLSGAQPFERFATMINTELRRLGKPVPAEVSSL